MEHFLEAASPISAAAVSALFSAIWEGTVLAVCVLVCLRLLPRLSAASRSVIWMHVFFVLALLHIIPSFRNSLGVDGPMHASILRLDMRWSVALAGLWAAFSVWRGTQLISSAIRLRRLANRATPVAPGTQLNVLLSSGRSGRAVELCKSVEVERPCVFGFFRPRILIPPALLERLSALELQQVVLHEMEHLRRGDDWTNLLQKVGIALFPLNPVLMWVERRLCAERELACDDRVLRSGGARKAYALCLTRLAEYSMIRRSLSLVLGAWERRPELMRRVHRVLRRPLEPMGGWQAALATTSLLFGVLGGAITLSHSPQLVSFTSGTHATERAWSAPPSELDAADLRLVGGSPQLVKAVMDRPRGLSAYTTKPMRSNVRKRSIVRRSAPSEQAWIVLTAWSDTEVPPRLVFAVAQRNQPSYAAVPMPNGWLIVQI